MHDYEQESRRLQVQQELRRFSDEDLLLELRRRKRFMRLEYNAVVPRRISRTCDDLNAPDSYVYPRLFREMGWEISQKYLMGDLKIPGMKREKENETPFGYDERFIIPLNIVVEKP